MKMFIVSFSANALFWIWLISGYVKHRKEEDKKLRDEADKFIRDFHAHRRWKGVKEFDATRSQNREVLEESERSAQQQ